MTEERTMVISLRELDSLTADRDGWRLEARTVAASLHTQLEANAELARQLRDWTANAQKFEDDALEAGVEAEEARDERDALRVEVDELRSALQFETEQHVAKIADLENQLAAARQQRDNHVATKPGLT